MQMKALIAVFAVAAAVAAEAVTLAPETTEVVVARGAPGTVLFAAEELTNFLSRAFGRTVPVTRGEPTPGKTPIILGSNDLSVAAGLAPQKLPRDAFGIRVTDDRVYIAGTDDNRRLDWLIRNDYASPDIRNGTLYGVYCFLERFAGVRMYFPGELGEIVPRQDRIRIGETSFTEAPACVFRHFTTYKLGRWYEDIDAKARRERVNIYCRRLRMTREIPCCHGQYRAKLTKRFGEAHPEYFRLRPDGTRENAYRFDYPLSEHSHTCPSSGIWNELYLDARSYFRGEGPEVRGMLIGSGNDLKPGWGGQGVNREYYDVMPQDGLGMCHCENCKAGAVKGPNWATEIIWSQTGRLAQRLKDEGIAGTITQMAYHPYADVPKVDLPDNIGVQVARRGPWSLGNRRQYETECGSVRAWARKMHRKIWMWTYVGKFYEGVLPDIPLPAPRSWGRYYAGLSDAVDGYYAESETDWFFHHVLDYYVFSKVCWDPKTDVEALLAEHFRLMYGKGAKPMDRFFRILEEKWVREIACRTVDGPMGPVMATPSDYNLFTQIYTPKVMDELKGLLRDAVKAVGREGIEAKRIALVKRQFYDPLRKRATDYLDMISVEKGKAYDRAKGLKPATDWKLSKWRAKDGKMEVSEDKRRVRALPDPKLNDVQVFHRFERPAERLRPNATYRFSWYVRLKGVLPTKGGGGFYVHIDFGEGHDKQVWYPQRGRMTGDMEWVHQSVEAKAPADPRNFAIITFRLYDCTGEMEIEDATIEELPDASVRMAMPQGEGNFT